MKVKATLFAAAATLALAPAAHAYEGVYGAIGAGLSYMQPDRDTEGTGSLAFDSEADFRNGIGVYTALGYAYGNGWRFEGEFSYRNNDFRHFPGDGIAFSGWPTVSGNLESKTFLFNVIRDFNTGSFVTPFVGAGAGLTWLDASFGATAPAGVLAFDDQSSRRFAAQGIAGLAFALAENLSLDLTYRFLWSSPGEFVGTRNGAVQNISIDHMNHSAFAGLRWNFGGPAPAPKIQYKDCWDGSSVPMSADCPPQITEKQSANLNPVQFTVYFDYDKANLTSEASNLVREAAARALQNEIDTVVVTGNTDTSGSAAYNQRLSERRAAVVRDALIANGVSANKIRVQALGESNPAKPTPDGVREPLNRRTDVTISFE